MTKESEQIFLSFSVQRDAVHLVASKSSRIVGLGSKELVQEFDHEGIRSEEILFENSIDILRKLREPYGGRALRAGVVIGQELVLIKRVPVALGLDKEQVIAQLEWETKQFCISSPEEYNVASQKMAHREPGGNQIFLLVLMRKKIIHLIHRLVKQSDLKLVDLEVDLFANFRLFQTNLEPDAGETHVMVRIQDGRLTFTVLSDKAYRLSHKVPVQSSGDTEEEMIEKLIPLISRELKHLIFAHRLGNDIQDLKGVHLLSESPLHMLKQALASELHVPVEQVNPFMRFAVSDKLIHTRHFSETPGRFAPCLGQIHKIYPAFADKAAAGI